MNKIILPVNKIILLVNKNGEILMDIDDNNYILTISLFVKHLNYLNFIERKRRIETNNNDNATATQC